MKAIVDQDTCTGCGLCAQTCPEVFQMEADKAKVLGEAIPEESLECSKEAAQGCPVEAIKIEE